MLSRRELSRTMTVVKPSEQRGKTLAVDSPRFTKNAVTRTTMEASFLVDGLGLDPSLFESAFESPIHHLPPELLSHVFSFDDHTSNTFPTSFAWTAAHVCSHWRQVALSTPRLWSTIALDLSSFHVYRHRLNNRLQFLDTCLERSKCVPLDFIVALPFPRIDLGVCKAVFERLCLHTRRWRRAFFFAPTDVLAPWMHLIKHNTPILQSLGFGSIIRDIGSVDLLQSIVADTGVPRLTLTSGLPEAFAASHMPWHQITSLKLICCILETLPAILSRLPNLMELEFEGILSPWLLPFTHAIELPNISTLGVSGYLHQMAHLLPMLDTPALVDLSVTLFKAPQATMVDNAAGVRAVRNFVKGAKSIKQLKVKYMDQAIIDTPWEHAIRSIL
ncbi:hypothetical protein NP233_g5896 [Leucocoprinus birnbaumii]|uniref:F-box domain-containing protein n=1 Tax=Leucocoprinus birnbaumii TaxID=56174 RepID=A0AAD5VSC5_9AGAR|nr:hypothetical protein NP233_g5896 [Leucocoprinus birnbaumii]